MSTGKEAPLFKGLDCLLEQIPELNGEETQHENRKRKATESDTSQGTTGLVKREEEEDDSGNDQSGGSVEPEAPKVKSQSAVLYSLPVKKKQKTPSLTELELGEGSALFSKPTSAIAKMPRGRPSKAGREITKEKERSKDHMIQDTDTSSNNQESDDEQDGDYEEEEEEKGNHRRKGKKKKQADTASPKKSASPKVKREPKVRSAKNNSKEHALALKSEDLVVTLGVVAGKKNGGVTSNYKKSSALTKAEMEIVFDSASENMMWAAMAETLNEKSDRVKHTTSNLKKHWVKVLRKRVVDGYID